MRWRRAWRRSGRRRRRSRGGQRPPGAPRIRPCRLTSALLSAFQAAGWLWGLMPAPYPQHMFRQLVNSCQVAGAICTLRCSLSATLIIDTGIKVRTALMPGLDCCLQSVHASSQHGWAKAAASAGTLMRPCCRVLAGGHR